MTNRGIVSSIFLCTLLAFSQASVAGSGTLEDSLSGSPLISKGTVLRLHSNTKARMLENKPNTFYTLFQAKGYNWGTGCIMNIDKPQDMAIPEILSAGLEITIVRVEVDNNRYLRNRTIFTGVTKGSLFENVEITCRLGGSQYFNQIESSKILLEEPWFRGPYFTVVTPTK